MQGHSPGNIGSKRSGTGVASALPAFVAAAIAPLIATLTGCAGGAEEPARVTIEAPGDGAVLAGDTVRVRLSASGIAIAPATGEAISGEAHHHLFMNVDVGPAGTPIPPETDAVGVKHLGTGDSAWTYRDLAPGVYRVIAVLADGEHVPLQPWAADTVEFRVTSGE